jgi:hypothetical protein
MSGIDPNLPISQHMQIDGTGQFTPSAVDKALFATQTGVLKEKLMDALREYQANPTDAGREKIDTLIGEWGLACLLLTPPEDAQALIGELNALREGDVDSRVSRAFDLMDSVCSKYGVDPDHPGTGSLSSAQKKEFQERFSEWWTTLALRLEQTETVEAELVLTGKPQLTDVQKALYGTQAENLKLRLEEALAEYKANPTDANKRKMEVLMQEWGLVCLLMAPQEDAKALMAALNALSKGDIEDGAAKAIEMIDTVCSQYGVSLEHPGVGSLSRTEREEFQEQFSKWWTKVAMRLQEAETGAVMQHLPRRLRDFV